MNSVDRSLKQLIDRHVPSPSLLEIAASRERILDQLSSQPVHVQTARIADTSAAVSRWRLSHAMAAAAGVVLAAVIGSVIVTPGDGPPRYQVVDGTVTGKDVIQTGAGGAMLALSDGSRVEMRSNSELSIAGVADGIGIRLRSGGIIVNAAKQETDHHLYVYTKDMTVSVVGTVFMVNADPEGSRVAVIEGEVRVRQGVTDKNLLPGDQVATRPAMAPASITEEIAWSRHADQHRALLQQSAVTPPNIQASAVSTEARAAFEATSVRLAAPGSVGARGDL